MPKKKNAIYNLEQKERFLAAENPSETMERLFRNVFEYVAGFEESRGADICTWGADEVREILQSLAGFRSYSSANRANLLKRYVQWCVDSHIAGATNVIQSINVDGNDKIRERLVSGPAHLQRSLDVVFTPELNRTTDNILRGYCWLAFMGMSEEQIIALEGKQVYLDTGVITVERRAYEIPTEAFVCFRILKESEDFRYYHAHYGKDFALRERAEGSRLLRGIRNPEPSIQNLRTGLSAKIAEAKKDKKPALKFSYSRLWLSGEFYRMYLREQQGGEVDFNYLGERAIRMREENNNPYKLKAEKGNRTENGKMRELAREYEKDYRNWKDAYYE